ncbi:dihydrodipicolinate reductase [Actibacterium sp. 188UL27-1]|uniref:dihydrodipicolinate reductase n=1 Tax=Actibacterium sp. 188UL27-1 TaxID=2786961 RepID=UPI001957E845|nr:dihydrodipicolinate reductase [Actibacterium sp. 188UL27-1]MBM7068513.1 dihydrodipicolinate reductase [Actibacterium sp. 188UL27-1]
MLRIIALCAALSVLPLSSAAWADQFTTVTNKNDFVSLISGRHLTRQGIKLAVSPGGAIAGRGFGRDVSGDWSWKGGYFCRDLFWGKRDLGFNCQQVQVNGSTLRFTSDRGAGRSADLRLR